MRHNLEINHTGPHKEVQINYRKNVTFFLSHLRNCNYARHRSTYKIGMIYRQARARLNEDINY